MKTGRIFALLAAAVMLAGCGAEDSSSRSEASSAGEAAVTTAAVTTDAADSSKAPEEGSSVTEESSSVKEEVSSAAETPPEEKPSDITPTMWEVTSDNGGRLVLMGSMHALKEECYPLPERIAEAYASSEALAVECDIVEATADSDIMLEEVQKMYYPVGETINDHISAEVIESVKGYAAKIGLDLTLYERCKPWVWLTLFEMRALNQLGLKTDLGIDNRLITQAKEDGKEIIELESTAFQMDLLTGYSDEICELLLAPYTADNADAYSEDLAQTYEAWKNGDFEFFEKSYSKAGQLQDLADAGYGPDTEQYKLMVRYIDSMQTDRNKGMTEKALKLLQEGRRVFLVVGEAHFCGEEGILSLLKAAGYEVRRL